MSNQELPSKPRLSHLPEKEQYEIALAAIHLTMIQLAHDINAPIVTSALANMVGRFVVFYSQSADPSPQTIHMVDEFMALGMSQAKDLIAAELKRKSPK